jgi:hypothetical protein
MIMVRYIFFRVEEMVRHGCIPPVYIILMAPNGGLVGCFCYEYGMGVFLQFVSFASNMWHEVRPLQDVDPC